MMSITSKGRVVAMLALLTATIGNDDKMINRMLLMALSKIDTRLLE